MLGKRGQLDKPRVLRGLSVGFGLLVVLLIVAVYVGYQGSKSIHDETLELLRQHRVTSPGDLRLEAELERRSQALLDDLEVVLGLCLIAAVTSATVAITITRRAFEDLEWQAAELARVSWHFLKAQEVTARRFSHEMHDELGQSLTGLRGLLKQLHPERLPEQRPQLIAVIDESLVTVRELSQLLRPVILDDFGLDAALRWLVERFAQRTGLAVHYESTFTGRLDEERETHLFRIAQEALTNIARHAEASDARVTLSADDAQVRIVIEDNGRGLPSGVRHAPSLGMVGMRARARHLQGDLRVSNREGGGVQIDVQVPRLPVPDGEAL